MADLRSILAAGRPAFANALGVEADNVIPIWREDAYSVHVPWDREKEVATWLRDNGISYQPPINRTDRMAIFRIGVDQQPMRNIISANALGPHTGTLIKTNTSVDNDCARDAAY